MALSSFVTQSRICGLLTLAILSFAGCKNPLDSETTSSAPVVSGHLPKKLLEEASGMAPSLRQTGALWLNNDSGDTATLYLISNQGKELGRVLIKGCEAYDWEDCASFSLQGDKWLMAADSGDNDRIRENPVLRFIREPAASELSAGKTTLAELAWSIHFSYPDGPHDCESVGVDAKNGLVYLVSKRTIPHRLYSLQLAPGKDSSQKAKFIGELAWLIPDEGLNAAIPTPTGRFSHQPTGLSFSQDGKMAALLTYGRVWLFEKEPMESWSESLLKEGSALEKNGLAQAEAVCVSADGKAIYVAGEGKNQPLLKFSLTRK